MPVNTDISVAGNKNMVKTMIKEKTMSQMENHAESLLEFCREHINSRTGNLERSLFVRKDGEELRIGTDVDYGLYLEFGTMNIRAQPWLSPAIDDLKKSIRQS